MRTQSARIAVVGGGASAVCLLDALAQADSGPGWMTVFEPSPYLWRGRPYQPDLTTVRVNSPPDDMSIRFGDPGHFEKWLATHGCQPGSLPGYVDPFSSVQFAPRAVYGDYLEQSARAALRTLVEGGWQVDLIRESVETARRTTDGVVLHTGQGRRVAVGHTVLCVGGGAPRDVYGLAGVPGFLPDPYPTSRTLAEIDPDHDVAVLGSGLTAVDVVIALAARGHRGRLSLVSRRGVLPAVRQRPVHHALRHFTANRFRALAGGTVPLDRLVAVMADEFAEAGEDTAGFTAELAGLRDEDPVARLRRHFAEVDSPRLALRILQRAVPDAGPDVWPLLSDTDKATVLRDHYRTVMSLCCPMPPASAATLLGLIDAGRLRVVAGVRHVGESQGGGFTISGTDVEDHADVVVNAVGAPSHRIPAKAAPLIASLLSTGAVNAHPHGGLHVERATSRLTVDGRPDHRLYALGDLATGSLFFTFGVPSLVDRAHDIVDALLLPPSHTETGSHNDHPRGHSYRSADAGCSGVRLPRGRPAPPQTGAGRGGAPVRQVRLR